jgi:hypothetical protein
MNSNIPYRVHKNMRLSAIPRQIDTVHILLPNFSKIHFNIILPSHVGECLYESIYKKFTANVNTTFKDPELSVDVIS